MGVGGEAPYFHLPPTLPRATGASAQSDSTLRRCNLLSPDTGAICGASAFDQLHYSSVYHLQAG